MTTLREAAQQALEALKSVEWYGAGSGWVLDADAIEVAITALRAALAEPTGKDSLQVEPEQEPVAWMTHGNDSLPLFHRTREGALAWGADPQPIYTAPPQRTPLTEQEIYKMHNALWRSGNTEAVAFVRALERAHGIGGQK